MKKLIIFSVVLLVLAALLASCSSGEEIEYIKSQSAVLSYGKEDNKVAVHALITLKNNEKRDIEFTLNGKFSELYEAGVVLYEDVTVTDKNGFSEKLTIPANTTVCLKCVFRTTYGGGTMTAGEDGFFAPPDSIGYEIIPESTYGIED